MNLKCYLYLGKFVNIDILRSGYYKLSVQIRIGNHKRWNLEDITNTVYADDVSSLCRGKNHKLESDVFHIVYEGQEISLDGMGVYQASVSLDDLPEYIDIYYKLYFNEKSSKNLSPVQKRNIRYILSVDTTKYIQLVFDGTEYSFIDCYFTIFIYSLEIQEFSSTNILSLTKTVTTQFRQLDHLGQYLAVNNENINFGQELSTLFPSIWKSLHCGEEPNTIEVNDMRSFAEELRGTLSHLLPLWIKHKMFDFLANQDIDRKSYVEENAAMTLNFQNNFQPTEMMKENIPVYVPNGIYSNTPMAPTADYHLIVFVHGLLGNSEDFRQYRNQYINLQVNSGANEHHVLFYFSKANENRSYLNLPTMGKRLAYEVDEFIQNQEKVVSKISLFCHSLGGLIARFALRNKRLNQYRKLLHNYVTFATPHCSLMLHHHFLIRPILEISKDFTKSKLPPQLLMSDHSNLRNCALYHLAGDISLRYFRNVFLFGSPQDKSIAIGITYHQPVDPIYYMEDCLKKVKQDNLLTVPPYQNGYLKWDSFLPPKKEYKSTYLLENQKDIYRKIYNPIDIIPPIKPYVKEKSNNPLTVKILNFKTLPDIQQSAPPTRRSKAWGNIVFIIGGPGCGKGTQCEKIAKEFSYMHLSVGDLLRKEAAKHTTTGHEISKLMAEGKIVPMHITLKLLNKAMILNDTYQGFLIDGFPRQLDQAIEFEETIAKPKFVLYYECSKEMLEKRLLKRGQTSGRNDDNLETILKRFKIFEDKTLPVCEYYKKKNLCHKISAEGGIDEIFLETKFYFEMPPLYHPNIVFVLGGPGSGTQCEKLADEFQLVHLSTGDLLREEVAKMTEVGLEADKLMREGKMVPKKYLLDILRKKIAENMGAVGFLIDGFPRTLDQAADFEKLIGPCRAVLAYDCPLSLLEKRLLERGKTSGRLDDNLDTIKKRFATFKEQSLPVIQHYKQKGKAVEISSAAEIHEVYEESRKLFQRKYPCKHRNIIFLLGGPGAGKGTQSGFIVNEFKFKHISTGDLLRREIENQTPIGLAVTSYISKGLNAPMNIILELLKTEVFNNLDAPGILIDGFPRAMGNYVLTLRSSIGVGKPRVVLEYKCPLDVLENRLLERGKTSGRLDDNIETIRKRFHTFQNESMPEEAYKGNNILILISSTSLPEQIYENLKKEFSLSMPVLPFNDKEIVFVLGGPGSGKGTQCEQIIKNFGYIHISTGDLLRDEVSQKTDLGRQLEADMKEGKMISIVLHI
ncbi:hypothetical protein HDV06_000218 [Boothiomyces sp. JEL0866]|nr:hypothetical protein HDV06_000218 [Boothiomyces sp. JEL0866]